MSSSVRNFQRPIRILLVEDSRDHAILFQGSLGKAYKTPHTIDVAESLGEAFDRLGLERYDLIVLDLGLPESQGIETLDAFYEAMGRDQPVIVLTATDDESVGEEALRRGALDFLTKGFFGADQLARAVRYGLERWRQRIALDKAQRDLKSFAHMAAHDLKAPLKSISMYAGLLQDKVNGRQSDQEEVEFVGYVSDFANQAERLVESLLQFSLMGEKSVTLAPVELGEVVSQAVASARSSIEESKAEVTFAPLPRVQADPDLLMHVLQNLISNAIKYRGDTDPRIHVGWRDLGGEVEVAVTDNGQGIKDAYLERIFEPFSRLAGSDSEGVGLGLAICRRVVEAHHGQIWAVSEPGVGSTFRFTLLKSPPDDSQKVV
ncbi:ATP-binding protein [Pelagicoccus sp. SDUM812003]|uniref:sensor histidine kinase n=1 Tax=Pelagicoccus sp. SDUM812003 TaxID=3041267 RepID=UPI00280FF4A0|nr:ATP-binding protein [Pelagicoccus sp. SDUM812003]MDQ8202995.1 ATP-binding protein [Pelagicoccus sp. SDUM812003]